MSFSNLQLGRDYVVENGLVVFTSDYLRRRGYCCKSGCRNCPYGFCRPTPACSSTPETMNNPENKEPNS